MKALSLWPPWGSFIAGGFKRIETRSWSTSYRGWLAIHQTKTWDRDVQEDCLDFSHFRETLVDCGFTTLRQVPLGSVLAVARLVDCVPTTSPKLADIGELERRLGNYLPGRFGWVLNDVIKLPEPIPAKGMQGIWEWAEPEEIRRLVCAKTEGN